MVTMPEPSEMSSVSSRAASWGRRKGCTLPISTSPPVGNGRDWAGGLKGDGGGTGMGR